MSSRKLQIREAREMFQGLCQEATNRMVDLGNPEVSFNIVECEGIVGGIHLQLIKNEEVVSEFHIWSPGDSLEGPSEYEDIFIQLCHAISEAERTGAIVMLTIKVWSDRFGPPSHGGRLN